MCVCVCMYVYCEICMFEVVVEVWMCVWVTSYEGGGSCVDMYVCMYVCIYTCIYDAYVVLCVYMPNICVYASLLHTY